MECFRGNAASGAPRGTDCRRTVRHWLRFAAGTLAAVASLGGATPLLAQSQSPGSDYYFLIDVSGSMAGQFNHANIFPQVSAAILQFVTQLEPGAGLVFLPFDRAISSSRNFTVRGPRDTAEVAAYLRGLQATGTSTAVYNSIDSAMKLVAQRRTTAGGNRSAVLFVYTDGDDNVSAGWTLPRILERFEMTRGSNDWLFYTELGLPRSAAKAAAFERAPHARYDNTAEGQVPQIVFVQTLIPVLHFGNIKAEPNATRSERFSLQGQMPQGLRFAVESHFDQVAALGALVELQPRAIPFADSVAFRVALTNGDVLPDGPYRGWVRFVPSDPMVRVVPDSVAVTFVFEPARTVEVAPASGTRFPLDFGVRPPGAAGAEPVSRSVLLRFNAAAQRAGDTLRFKLEQSDSNPQLLTLGTDVKLEGIDGEQGSIPAGSAQLTLALNRPDGVKPGRYAGSLVLESETMVVSGAGLEPRNEGKAQALRWSFEAAKPPLPLWVWLLLGAVAVAGGWFFRRQRNRPAQLGDLTLVVVKPNEDRKDLKGRISVSVGQGNEGIAEESTLFTIFADKQDGGVVALLKVNSGKMTYQEPASSLESPVEGELKIVDKMVLNFGQSQVRVESGSYKQK